jgi:hypothetical protein
VKDLIQAGLLVCLIGFLITAVPIAAGVAASVFGTVIGAFVAILVGAWLLKERREALRNRQRHQYEKTHNNGS